MNGDILYLRTADGEQLFVPDEEVRFLAWGNGGAPPVKFLTRKGYKQHGATEIDYLLDPRSISVQLWRAPACSRQAYWDNRLALHEFLRHNRGGPLWFVLRQPNGAERALVVRADPGLQFPMPGTDTNNWDVEESIDFTAFDPIWFDPDCHTAVTACIVDQQLVFPITFPIRFGGSGYLSSLTVTYAGTWATYPTLTVYGPYTSAILKNIATGAMIYLTVSIPAGDKRILDLTPGAQRLTDSLGVNKFTDLGVDSDLVGFCLKPNPEVAGGIQEIQALFTGGALGTSALQIDYYDRYFAI